MAINRTKKLLTYADYAAMPDDGKRYELIDGELAVCPAPTPTHQRLLWRLTEAFVPYLQANKLGEMLFAPLDVVLDPYQVLQPDLLFVSRERAHCFTEANLQGAPDFVVEILSPGTMRRDLGRKRQLYDQFGVGELWIVHQKQARVDVYRRRAAGTLVRAASLGPGDALGSDLFPGFTLDLGTLFDGLVPAH